MKRSIKKLALAVVLAGGLVAGFGSVAFAGGPHGQGHGRGFGGPEMFKKLDGMSEQERLEFLETKLDERIARMTDKLELSADQQGKVRQVMADAQTQLLEIYEKNKDVEDKSTARGEAHAVLKQAKQDVGDILTDDQKAKIKEQREQRHRRGKGKMVDRLDEKLDLSDAQRAKVEKILDTTHKQMKDLRKNATDEEAARAKGKELMKGAGDQINKVLTKPQQAEFAKMRKRMEERGHGRHGEGRSRKNRGAF